MHHIAIISIVLLASGNALAGGSVIEVNSNSAAAGKSVSAGSIITIDCTLCPPLKAKDNGPGVHGVEVIEMEINGQNKVVQTDNLMGGTAVRYVKNNISKPQPANRAFAGETVTHSNGGTEVTSRHTIIVPSNSVLVIADAGSSVTMSGGGDFNVEEVQPDEERQDGVDDGSQTSSVNMNDAQHDNIEVDGTDEPEILELRPTQ